MDCRRISISIGASCPTSSSGFPHRPSTTRACTLTLNNDHSSLRFPKLKIDYMIHLLLSHTNGAELPAGQPFLRSNQPRVHREENGAIPEGDRNTCLIIRFCFVHVEHDSGNHENQQLRSFCSAAAAVARSRADRAGLSEQTQTAILQALFWAGWTSRAFTFDSFGTRKSGCRDLNPKRKMLTRYQRPLHDRSPDFPIGALLQDRLALAIERRKSAISAIIFVTCFSFPRF